MQQRCSRKRRPKHLQRTGTVPCVCVYRRVFLLVGLRACLVMCMHAHCSAQVAEKRSEQLARAEEPAAARRQGFKGSTGYATASAQRAGGGVRASNALMGHFGLGENIGVVAKVSTCACAASCLLQEPRRSCRRCFARLDVLQTHWLPSMRDARRRFATQDRMPVVCVQRCPPMRRVHSQPFASTLQCILAATHGHRSMDVVRRHWDGTEKRCVARGPCARFVLSYRCTGASHVCLRIAHIA